MEREEGAMNADIHGDDWDPGEALAKDGSGAALRQIRDALQQGQAVLKARLDRGVAPEEFRRGQALLGSYAAAARGMERAWEKRHTT